jgi:hypothetical protein
MFSPWAPFFPVLTAGRVTAARNKFRSATETYASELSSATKPSTSSTVL